MASLRTFIHKSAWSKRKSDKGFTLIEFLIVMAILVTIGGFGLIVSMDTYRSSDFYSDRDLLVVALQHARAQSMHNVCSGTCTDGVPHGVHVAVGSYTLFQGTSYVAGNSNNQQFTAALTTTHTPATWDVVFTQLSGTTTATSATLSDASGHTSTIMIGSEGQISWTH